MATDSFWRADIDPEREPRRILLARGVLTDAARGGRSVPYKLYHPADAGDETFPLVIWSHGLGGSRDGAGFIARFVASHGYIVCHIQHPGTDSSLWEGKPGHPWDNIRKAHISRDVTLDRFRDVPFLLDNLDRIAADHPQMPRMDRDAIGMCGHSFGALTTQVMAGQLFPDAEGKLIGFREPRFRAGILYSPVPSVAVNAYDPADIYGGIDLPLFHMTGTVDDSPVEKFGYEQRLAIFDHSGRAERQLLVLNGGDHMVYNGSRGQLEDNPKRGRHEDIIKIAALAYWDDVLKNDAKARSWLTSGGFTAWLDHDGRYALSPAGI